jgi:hypothetical protein
MAILKGTDHALANLVMDFAQLTAAATSTDAIKLVSDNGKILYKSVLFQMTLASVTTNVIIRLEGSLDGVNWFNLDEDNDSSTYDTNGTYGILYQGLGEILYIRFYWVSEAGGTAATLNIKAKIFG